MTPEVPGGNPKKLWQSQQQENTTMSAQELRRKARKFAAKTRRNNAIGAVFSLVGLAFILLVLITAPSLMARTIAAIAGVLIASDWIRSMYTSYSQTGRLWRPSLPVEAPMSTCLDHYRSELERELRYTELPKSRMAGAVVITVFLTWNAVWRSASPAILRTVIPFVLLLTGFMALLIYVRIREARKLKDELAALERFEGEGG